MDYERFLARLPEIFDGWGSDRPAPRQPEYARLLQRVKGFTSPPVLALLNAAVDCLEPGESYCEVGLFRGATLIGSLLGHPEVAALGVDNFCELDPHKDGRQVLQRNLAELGVERQVQFHERDFEELFVELRAEPPTFGVYFYDGVHDYRSQLMALLMVRPFLASQALLVVDDANWESVRQASWDFISAQVEAKLLLDLPGRMDADSFWNGLHVIAWETDSSRRAGWPLAAARKERDLLESLEAIGAPEFKNLRDLALKARQGRGLWARPPAGSQ